MAENPRIEELRRRVHADPASIAFAALAEEFRRVGRYEEAVDTCRNGLQRHPAYLSARVTLGRALIETGDFEGARQELETVLRSAPENLAAIRGLAQIEERLGHSTAMDPHLADIMKTMHAESIRVAAPPPPPPPPPPSPAPAPVAEVEPAHEPEPAFVQEPEPAFAQQSEPAFVQEPEPAIELPLHLESAPPQLEPEVESTPQAAPESQVEVPATVEPDAAFELTPRSQPAPAFEPEPRFDPKPESAPEPAFALNPESPAQPQAHPEPHFDLSLAPPLERTSTPGLDLKLTTFMPDAEPTSEAPGEPDPETLATVARLERFLGAIQSLRA